jgi:hypothetical protein
MTTFASERLRDAPGAAQIDIPPAAAEESEPLKGVPDEKIIQRLETLVTACDDYASHRYRTIRRMWRLYYEQYDFSRKQAWQSKISMPRTFATVEAAVALYSAGLIPSDQWFRIVDSLSKDDARGFALEQVMRPVIRSTGFYEQLRLGLMSGFLGGLIPTKVGVDSRGPIHYPVHQLWDPLDVKLDWSGRNRFLVLESEVDGYTLREWAKSGLFEEERVEQAIKSSPAGNLRDRQSSWDRVWPGLHCREFWGDLVDDDGTLLMANCTFMVINGSVLLRRPIENPFDHGSPPIVLGAPLRVPYRVWAPSMMEHVAGLARMFTELANAVMDATLFASVQAYQYDVARVRPADLRRGIYPGKMFAVTDLQMGPGIERFEAGKVPSDSLGVMNMLDQEMQRDTGITEHTTGTEAPGSGGRKTAREVLTRHTQSMGIIRSMAHDLEVTYLEPLLNMTLSVFAQVTARNPRVFLQPDIRKVIGMNAALALQLLDEQSRTDVLTKGIRHQARGISSSISVNEDLQRLLGFAEMAAKVPEMWGRIRHRSLLERAAILHRLPPDEILVPEQEYQQGLQRRAAAMAQMQGASSPGQQGKQGQQLVRRRRALMPGEQRQVPQLSA